MYKATSQLPGVFYRRPAPDQEPFVEEGSVVEDGQTLGLVEVMKTFNEVRAERPGRVSRILLAEGEEVEPGQELFEVEDG